MNESQIFAPKKIKKYVKKLPVSTKTDKSITNHNTLPMSKLLKHPKCFW